MFCAQCGNELLAQALICPKCGCGTEKYNKRLTTSEKPIGWGEVVSTCILGALIPIIGWMLALYYLFNQRLGYAIFIALISTYMYFYWFEVFSSR